MKHLVGCAMVSVVIKESSQLLYLTFTRWFCEHPLLSSTPNNSPCSVTLVSYVT